MEANLLPAIGIAKMRELTADEMDLISGAVTKISLPWVTIYVCNDGSWNADFVGGTTISSGPQVCLDAPLPR